MRPSAEKQRSLYRRSVDSLQSLASAVQDSYSPEAKNLPVPTSSDAPLLYGGTARPHNLWRQTRRLWRLAFLEWATTAVLCGGYLILLKVFLGKSTISSVEATTYNVIFTSLAFFLGINLTASLRSYAKQLRWLILSRTYMPIELFDLCLRCDELSACWKIVWNADKHRSRARAWRARVFAALWLLMNLVLVLFVGMIGLTASLVPSQNNFNTVAGTISFTNFSGLETGDLQADLKNVQSWGERGFGILGNSGYYTPSLSSSESYGTLLNGSTRYWLQGYDFSSFLRATQPVYMQTTANCTHYEVLSGGDGTGVNITTTQAGPNKNVTISGDIPPGPFGISFSTRYGDHGGPQISWVNVFVAGNGTIRPVYFQCDSTLSVGIVTPNQVSSPAGPAPEAYQVSNDIVRMLAGAIGWNGDFLTHTDTPGTWQSEIYKNFTPVAIAFRAGIIDGTGVPDEQYTADFISSYTSKTIAAMDRLSDGLQVYTEAQGSRPVPTQILDCDWFKAKLLLFGIPGLQLIATLLVFWLGTRTLIKDDSPLIMAQLYYNVLKEKSFGARGGMLRWEELCDEMDKEGPTWIRYGATSEITWRRESLVEGANQRRCRRVGAWLESEDGDGDVSGRFNSGEWYD